MAAGKVAEACPRYAESQKLDPQLGTLLHLADCLEKKGQTASAWAAFRDASEIAEQRGDARKKFADKRIKALAPKLSRLQINVPQGAELHVERDSVVVGNTLLNSPVPTDPGSHTVTASATGRKTWTGTVVVKKDGSTAVITIPELEKEAPAIVAAPVTPTEEATPKPAAAEQDEEPADGEHRSTLSTRWPALAAGAVGVAGVAVGSVFGLKSMSKKKEADQHCDGADCRDQDGVALRHDAFSAGNISTIGFVVGGVGLATGVVLWFALPASSSQKAEGRRAGRTRVALTPSTVSVEHVW
jgi:hypothetical protein